MVILTSQSPVFARILHEPFFFSLHNLEVMPKPFALNVRLHFILAALGETNHHHDCFPFWVRHHGGGGLAKFPLRDNWIIEVNSQWHLVVIEVNI